MKKTINTLLILALTLLFVSCTKTPFKEEKPLANSELVYVYVLDSGNENDAFKIPYYEIKINSKPVEGKIYPYEFLKYNLDSESVTIEAVRNQIEKKALKVDLTKGKAHYLKITSHGSGFANFDFEVVSKEKALQEIKSTKYAIPEEGEVLDILVTKEKLEKQQQSKQVNVSQTKAQKIKDAHALKQDGIITDQEFEKLKAEIINAN